MIGAVVLVAAALVVGLAILWSIGMNEPVYATSGDEPAWFVALKYKAGRLRPVLELPSGIRQTWTVNADFTFIGRGERYWDRFMILTGTLYESRMPLMLGDDFEDAYVVWMWMLRPPPLALGMVRSLHVLGIWSMPKGQVATDPAQVGMRSDALPSKESIATLLSRPRGYQPAMVNFLKYKTDATYPDRIGKAKAKVVSGRTAYSRYGLVALQTVYGTGGRLAFFGRAGEVLHDSREGPTHGAWDDIAVMEYSEPKAILTMEQIPRYLEALKHRDAGLDRTVIIAASHERVEGR